MARWIAQYRGLLAVIITLLALADGVLHLSLDYVLFRGNLFGRLGPPPGAPSPPPGGGGAPAFLVPLNQAFVLNFCGYLALVLILWFVGPRLGTWQWLVDALVAIYVVAVFIAWLNFGAPNPRGLGYLSKTIEILLIIVSLVRLWADIVSTTVQTIRAGRLSNS